MIGRLSIAFWILFTVLQAGAADLDQVCPVLPHSRVEVVSSGSGSYTIPMGGRIDGASTRDPIGYWGFEQYWEPNISVRLENIGTVPVVNPWLRRKGRPDTRTLDSIVRSVISPQMSDAEKARRIWEFEIHNRFHGTTQDGEVQDAVKRFNAYGYTLCYDESRVMSDLWRAAGLKVRKGFPNGHSTAEVFYDSAWHLLDSDESIICLLRDNKTIASEAQIVADHDLMKRVHTYGPLHDDNRLRDESGAALHLYEGERTGEQPSMTHHTMAFTLRPGEAITWAWNHTGRYHGKEFSCCGAGNEEWIRNWRLPQRIVNGELSYSPDLADPATARYVALHDLRYRAEGTLGPGLYAGGDRGSIEVPIASAYPIVGGSVRVDLGRVDMNRQHVTAFISFDDGATWKKAGASYQGDYRRWLFDLNAMFPPAGEARYSYRLRLELTSQVKGAPLCLKGLRLDSTLQMAELSLPGMALGNNTFVYSDESGPGAKVRITHLWKECGAAELPGRVETAVSPGAGGKADGTKVRFEWKPPASGARPADYQFQLSEYADLRWPLSPTFNRLVDRTRAVGTASFQTPYLGLINPGQTYYWRVRARSEQGVWGAWSPAFAFTALAPAVPSNVVAHFDASARMLTLGWEPGESGTKPVRYRIYGSAERGFTASDVPYQLNAGKAGTQNVAENLLVETKDAATHLELPASLWRAYYRVAAIDSEGRESGPSALAEAAHPIIRSTAIPDAHAGRYYEARIETAASIGHLVSTDDYDMGIRNGDVLEFSMTDAPKGLSISPVTGTISGFLPAGSSGSYQIHVTVSNKKNGARDTIRLALRVQGA